MNLPDDVLGSLVPPDAPAAGPQTLSETYCHAACCNPSFPQSFGPLYDVLSPERAAQIDYRMARMAAWREQSGEYYVPADERTYWEFVRKYDQEMSRESKLAALG